MDISYYREELEPRLGHALNESDHERYEDLLRVPPHLIEEARKLDGIGRLLFWRFYSGESHTRAMADFHEEVVKGNLNPIEWGLGRILVAAPSLPQSLTGGVPLLRDLLGEPTRERWFRIRPVSVGESTGALAVLRPELDYTYEPATPSVKVFVWRTFQRLEPVFDVPVAGRRWMAQRMALALPAPLEASARTTEEFLAVLLEALRPDHDVQLENVHPDVWIAARGLLKEWRELAPKTGIPGFRGPDEWYEPNDTSGR